MTVKELIEKLKEFPDDLGVFYADNEYFDAAPILSVKVIIPDAHQANSTGSRKPIVLLDMFDDDDD